jgi:hypothetical protein
MELNEFVCLMGCFAKLEVWPLVLNARLCSLNVTIKLRPVSTQYLHMYIYIYIF